MNNRMVQFATLVLINTSTIAATEQLIWGEATNHLGLMQQHQTSNTNYQLKPVDPDEVLDAQNQRFQLYYKDLPVWGHEIIEHTNGQSKGYQTGLTVTGIERDIKNLNGKLSAEQAEQQVLASTKDSIMFKNTEKIIFLDAHNKARLAYEVSLFTNSQQHFMQAPHSIIDANSGEVLKAWNDLNHVKLGQGLGGNVLIMPYRSGLFQHGKSQPELPSLGKFDITIKKDRCFVETPEIRVINANETTLTSSSFPLISLVEYFMDLPTFSYPCSKQSGYVNKNDGNTAPANLSFSSINDTMYFAVTTLDMYKHFYGVEKPIGTDLPLRAYTHIKGLDNAFAVPQVKIKGITLVHQQIIIGDGDELFTAPAQGTLAHELSHNFTRLYSNLKYEGHSGGINESFSDMASIAMQDYLRNFYSWYWDGLDWTIGREATLTAEPLRYMDDPEQDGHSISNAQDFYDSIDVHESSGVFNKAFYLLAHKPDWNVRQAFQVMVDANKKYWTSSTHFDAAACGVIQAAKDRHYGTQAVIDAFEEVGVVCPLKHFM